MARLPHANRTEAGSIIWVFLLGFASTLVSMAMIGSRWRRLFTTRSVHHTPSNLDTVTVDRGLVPVPDSASATANRPAPVDNDHGAAHLDQAGSGPIIRLTIPSLPSIGEVLRRARDFPIPVHASIGQRRLAIAGFAAVVLAIGLSPVGEPSPPSWPASSIRNPRSSQAPFAWHPMVPDRPPSPCPPCFLGNRWNGSLRSPNPDPLTRVSTLPSFRTPPHRTPHW